eukprot:352854-Chlamydomonas_euryale.AAC.2
MCVCGGGGVNGLPTGKNPPASIPRSGARLLSKITSWAPSNNGLLLLDSQISTTASSSLDMDSSSTD